MFRIMRVTKKGTHRHCVNTAETEEDAKLMVETLNQSKDLNTWYEYEEAKK